MNDTNKIVSKPSCQIDQLSDKGIMTFDILHQNLSAKYKLPKFPVNPLNSENKEEVSDLLLDSLAAFPLHYPEDQEDQLSPKEMNRMNDLLKDSLSVFHTPRFIGFAGAHRTGKSTLAERVANELDYVYLPVNVANDSVWDSFNPHEYFTFAERIEVQERLLNAMEIVLYKKTDDNNSYITDRTPIDILAYLLSNIDQTTSELYDSKVEHLIWRCHQITLLYFSDVFVVQPSIPFEKIPGKNNKVYNSRTYQLVLTSNIIGQLSILTANNSDRRDWNFYIIPTSKSSLKDRIEFCIQLLR